MTRHQHRVQRAWRYGRIGAGADEVMLDSIAKGTGV
jgi:hypothetical protein